MAEENETRKVNNRSPWYAWKWLAAGLVLVYLLVYMPTTYVIFTAGSAEAVKPMVEVADADTEEQGTFMLTTVRRVNANLLLLAWNAFNDDAEYSRKSDTLRGRTEEEYMTELVFSMTGSQSNAMLAAYNALHIPYKVEPQGVYLIRNMPNIAKNDFQPNDRVIDIESHPITTIEDLKEALKPYKAGDELDVIVERGGKQVQAKATLVTFDSSSNPGTKQTGFGSYYGQKTVIVPDDESKKITFKDSDIGGPSAGLMFTLEIMNQLSPGDLSRGIRIAGTGEITPEGKVGIIGGIQHKVVAADREGAELFLVPEGNYAEAKEKVDKMDTKMKLVPVKTLDDALKAIEQFEKPQS